MSVTTYLRFMFVARPTAAPTNDSSDRAWAPPSKYPRVIRRWDRGRVFGDVGGKLETVDGRDAIRVRLEPLALHPRYAIGGAQRAYDMEREAGTLDQCRVSAEHYTWTAYLAGIYLPVPGRLVSFMEHPTLHTNDVVGIMDVGVEHAGPLPFDVMSLTYTDRMPVVTRVGNWVEFVFQPQSLAITRAWPAHFVDGYSANPGMARSTQGQVEWLPPKTRICVHDGSTPRTVWQQLDRRHAVPKSGGTPQHLLYLHVQVLPFRLSMRLATVRGAEHALWHADVACPGLRPVPDASIYTSKTALGVPDIPDAKTVVITHADYTDAMFDGVIDLSDLWSLRITPTQDGLNVALLHTLTSDPDPVVAFQETITWSTMELE